MRLDREIKMARKSAFRVNPVFLNRWSPRAMTFKSMPDKDLMRIFEAARWAPSSFNEQPWIFLYTKRENSDWEKFFGLLLEGNKKWAQNASVLMVLVTNKFFTHHHKPNISCMFDAGAAWENLALQALELGWYAHAMVGFDVLKARKELSISDEYEIAAMIAVGKKDKKEIATWQKDKSKLPSGRKDLKDIIREGGF